MRNDPKPGFVTASQAGSGLLLQFLDGLLEFRCHRRVSMSLRLQRTRTVCINRLGWFAELNESATQPAPGISLVFGQGEVSAQMLNGCIPIAQLLVLARQAKIRAGILRIPLEHSLQCRDSLCHEIPAPLPAFSS